MDEQTAMDVEPDPESSSCRKNMIKPSSMHNHGPCAPRPPVRALEAGALEVVVGSMVKRWCW